MYFNGLILLYISILARKEREKGAFINNLTNAIVLIISITINLVLIQVLNLPHRDFIVFPFNFLMIIFIGIYFPILYLFIFREKKKFKKRRKNVDKKESSSFAELPFKYEIYRKLTHLVVLGIIFFYFHLGFLLQNVFKSIFKFLPEFISEMFNENGDIMVFTQNLVVFLVGVSLIGLLAADIIRILAPEIYPLKPVNRILREKELHMRVGPHISMSIGCFSIIILYGLFQPIGPLIICTSIVMAIFGDIASNLIGRIIGTNKIRNTNKTYEGLFAGMVTSFISGIIVLLLLKELYMPALFSLFFIPLIGSVIIGLIDYLDLVIDDNLSYNFILSTILFFILTFLE